MFPSLGFGVLSNCIVLAYVTMLNVFLRVSGEKKTIFSRKAKELINQMIYTIKDYSKDEDRIAIHDSFSECCFPAYKNDEL